MRGLETTERRRAALLRHIWRPKRFRALLDRFAGRAAVPAGRVALLAGDIEAKQEAALVQREAEALRADLLLVPHHGSRTSSTAVFLDAVQPRLSVVQVGRRNRYGHPAPDVMARYQAADLPVLSTPDCGAVMWRSLDLPKGAQRTMADLCWRLRKPRYWQVATGNEPNSMPGGEP